MKVRSIDSQNDWTFGSGLNNYKKDRLAVMQNVKTRLQSFLGDCFFDLSSGIDWFNLMGSKNLVELKLAVSSTILNTENIEEIIEVSVVLDQNRVITIEYSAVTSYGIITDQINQGAA